MTVFLPPEMLTAEERAAMAKELRLPEGWFEVDARAQKYDPNQPRHPAGSSTGGQWVSPGSSVTPGGGIYRPFDDKGMQELDGVPNTVQDVEQGYFAFAGPGQPDDETLPPPRDTINEELGIGELVPHGNTFASEYAVAFHERHKQRHYDYRTGELEEYDQEEALSHYQTDGYREMNAWAANMAHDPDGEFAEDNYTGDMVLHLDNVLRGAPQIPGGTTTLRAFRSASLVQEGEDLVGRTFRDPRFLSTSLNTNLVYNWAQAKDSTANLIIMRLRNPRAQNGLYLTRNAYDSASYEYEVLYPRNTAFTVRRVVERPLSDHDATPVTLIDVDIVDANG